MNHFKLVVLLSLALLAGCPDEREDGDHNLRDAGAAGASTKDAEAADAGRDTSAQRAADLALERESIAKLKTCGLFEPAAEAALYAVRDEYDRCTVQCELEAPCEQLQSFVCGAEEDALLRCLEACENPPRDGFLCNDGTRIPHAELCDSLADCQDGHDEDNCGEFRCMDGEIILASAARCDWIQDCYDGSDELGCAFSCSDAD